jgi:hypothetical protein
MSNPLTKTIMESILTHEPEKKHLVTFRRAFMWGLLGLFTFFSSLFITLFGLDILEKFTRPISFFPFELLLIALAFCVGTYFISRNTELPIVKNRLKLGLIVMFLVLVLSLVGVSVVQNNVLGIKQQERRLNSEFNRRRFPQERPRPPINR